MLEPVWTIAVGGIGAAVGDVGTAVAVDEAVSVGGCLRRCQAAPWAMPVPCVRCRRRRDQVSPLVKVPYCCRRFGDGTVVALLSRRGRRFRRLPHLDRWSSRCRRDRRVRRRRCCSDIAPGVSRMPTNSVVRAKHQRSMMSYVRRPASKDTHSRRCQEPAAAAGMPLLGGVTVPTWGGPSALRRPGSCCHRC